METKTYKYTLSSWQKGLCPACGRMTLSLYVDNQTGQIVHPKVGLCKHETGSRYHYPPRKYFIDNSIKIHKQKTEIVMEKEMENQQETNKLTSEQVTSSNFNADGNEHSTPTSEPATSPIVIAGDSEMLKCKQAFEEATSPIVSTNDNEEDQTQPTSEENTSCLVNTDRDVQQPVERKLSAFEIADALDDLDFLQKRAGYADKPKDRFPPMW